MHKNVLKGKWNSPKCTTFSEIFQKSRSISFILQLDSITFPSFETVNTFKTDRNIKKKKRRILYWKYKEESTKHFVEFADNEGVNDNSFPKIIK